MKRFFSSIAIQIVAASLVFSIGSTLDAESRFFYRPVVETARKTIWRELSNSNAASASFAMMIDGRIVHSETFGTRDRLAAKRANRQTRYNIGSVSKVITAAAMLTLVDRGEVELDESVTSYLPDFHMADIRYQDITVRMLLNHSSGLPGTNYRDGFGAGIDDDYAKETLDYLVPYRLKHEPGAISVYCNDGFTLARLVVESVAGTSFEDYVQKQVFRPLRMRRSSCQFKRPERRAARVYTASSGNVEPIEYVNALATGGITSTADDLCRFSLILRDDKVLSTESLAEFTQAQYAPGTAVGEEPFFKFGLGWDTVAFNQFAEQGVTVMGKSGGTFEYSAQLLVAPEENMSVAVIFAGPGIDATSVANVVMQSLLEREGIVPTPTGVTLPPGDAAIPDDVLAMAGYYADSNAIMRISFDVESNAMLTEAWNGEAFVLADVSDYKADGYFHSTGGNRYFLKNYEDANYLLLAEGETDVTAMVVAGGVPEPSGSWAGTAFANKRWLFRNAKAYDFSPVITDTGVISELPGFVFQDGITMLLCELASENSANVCLPHARDLLGLWLVEMDGEQFLSTGNFLYSDAESTATIAPGGGAVTIGENGYNEWLRIDADVVFSAKWPETGRVMVLSPNKQVVFDSLYGMDLPVAAPEGGYACFIGEIGDEFSYTAAN